MGPPASVPSTTKDQSAWTRGPRRPDRRPRGIDQRRAPRPEPTGTGIVIVSAAAAVRELLDECLAGGSGVPSAVPFLAPPLARRRGVIHLARPTPRRLHMARTMAQH